MNIKFKKQLEEISNNVLFSNYFENRDIIEFLNIHIQIDLVFQKLYQDKNPLLNTLKSIEKSNTDDTINKLLNIITVQINTPQISQESNFIKELNSSLNSNHLLQNIEQNINKLQQNFTSSSSKKGQVTENILFNNLIKLFSDSEVINTSHTPNSGDIQIIKDNKPTILIDSKNFNNNVPKNDLDKFYHDLKFNNCSGILCNSNAGIANRDNFEIDIQNNNVYLFISNHQFDNTLFKLAVKIIYNIHDIIKFNKNNNIQLDISFYNTLKNEYNYFLLNFKQHIDTIKSNVLSLEKLTMTQLDNFFKYKVTENKKQFTCNICSLQYTSTKTLNSHIKTKH